MERLVFNAPPGWPSFPPDWQPPVGWEPDPTWPAPPAGWRFWVPGEDRVQPPDPDQGALVRAIRRKAGHAIVSGVVLLVLGAGFVVIGQFGVGPGGTAVVFWGAIALGALQLGTAVPRFRNPEGVARRLVAEQSV